MNLRRVTPAGNLDRLPGRKGESARWYCGDLDHRHCGGSARSLDRVADQTAESSREGSFDPPHPLTEKSTADGVPFTLSRYKMITHEALKNDRMTVNVA
jgi:hypothetical protein